jgi:hypothetical protein
MPNALTFIFNFLYPSLHSYKAAFCEVVSYQLAEANGSVTRRTEQ